MADALPNYPENEEEKKEDKTETPLKNQKRIHKSIKLKKL